MRPGISKPDNLQAWEIPNFWASLETRPVANTEWGVGTPSPERAELTELMGPRPPPFERTVQKGPFDGIDGIDGASARLFERTVQKGPFDGIDGIHGIDGRVSPGFVPGFVPGLARFHSGCRPGCSRF